MAKAGVSHPMKNIVDSWLAKIELAIQVRDDVFGQYACEAEQFFDGAHDWMWNDSYARGNGGFLDKEGGVLPNFRITVNKLFEAVALFGPALYAQNPVSTVTPTLPPEVPPEALGIDPMDPYAMQEYVAIAQQEALAMASRRACASVKQNYLNWLQTETDKKTEARKAIGEALVAGVGYMETVMHNPPGGKITMPRSRYVSWRDVVYDPDASYFEDVQWMAVRRLVAVNKGERQFGYERGTLKGHMQSFNSQTSPKAKKEAKQQRNGKSFDLLEYWDVYSKNGFGDLLFDGRKIPLKHEFDYEPLGDYCYIACARNIPWPLNIPSEVLTGGDMQELARRTSWPVPYWLDDNGWPLSRLAFYEKPNCIWPISLFKPAIGELRFVNWCLSFLADKVASSCTTYVGMLKEAGATIQQQLAGSMSPFTVIEIATALGKPLDQIVSFLQAPAFSLDIWKMIAEVLDLIDKRTGLTELIYGLSGTQMRSAKEAGIRDANTAVRPDDMASRTEDWLSEVQVREMQAARWFCEEQDIEPVCGQLGALVWRNYVMTGDVDDVVRGFDYRIEAGSARKPNKSGKAEQLISLGQYMLPVLQEMAVGGLVAPWNAYVADVAETLDIDPSPYMLPEPDPDQPSPEEQEARQELEIKMAELQMDMQKMRAELGMEREKLDMELEHEKEMHELDMTAKKDEIAAKKDEAKVKLKVTEAVGKAKAKQAAKPKAGAKR